MFSKNEGTQKMPYNVMRNVTDKLKSFMDRAQIIVVDCGRYEVKVRFPNGKTYAFPSRVVETNVQESSEYAGDSGGQRKTTNLTIGYRNRYFHVGSRAKFADANLRTNFDSKVTVDSVILSLASCYLAELEGCKDIIMVFGLPMEFMYKQKEYKKVAKSLTNLLKREHTVKINEKEYTFGISKVIFPYETASAFFSLFLNYREQVTGKDVLIIDVGSATTQGALYRWGEGVHTLVPESSFCIKEGYDKDGIKPIDQVASMIYQRVNQTEELKNLDLMIFTIGGTSEALVDPIRKQFQKGSSKIEVIKSKYGTFSNVEGMGLRAKNQVYQQEKKRLEEELTEDAK